MGATSKLIGVLAGIAASGTISAYWGFDHTVDLKHAEHNERHLAGCASWCNIYTCAMDSCTDCGSCTGATPVCAPWCNSYICDLPFCRDCGHDIGCKEDVPFCDPWCNPYTCGSTRCAGCTTCLAVNRGSHCEGWCNQYTCGMQHCKGCSICGYSAPAPPPPFSCAGHASTHGGEQISGADFVYERINDGNCCAHSSNNALSCGFTISGDICTHHEGLNCVVVAPSGRQLQGSGAPESTHVKVSAGGAGAGGAGAGGAGVSSFIDVNPTVSRVPPVASSATLIEKNVMMWDRIQAEEKTNMYGRLLDNFAQHCEVDGYCFGDLFADNAWVCMVDHTNVNDPYPEFDQIVPGATVNGKAVGGPGCIDGLGNTASVTISDAFRAIYGGSGTFQANGHQPRHTVNNFVVTLQNATHMTTQHYQIIERYFHFQTSDLWVGYDGSGYTVQIKWEKEGVGYTGLWKITQMAMTHNGDGHLGLPPDSDITQYQEFINAQRVVSGLSPFTARRQLQSPWTPPARTSGVPAYGALDPLATHIPDPPTDSQAVQMAWDREEMKERISMYSWLADETRTNILDGFAWGDLYAEGGMWCAYTTGSTFDWPNFDDYEQGGNFDGRGFGGGPCGAGAPQGCQSSCTPFMGGYSANILQSMITGTFGVGGAGQTRYQQTRHTLTNKIFIEQTMMTAKSWVYNTLERFIKGVAYDNSFFQYQHQWIKQRGAWKWAKISAYTQGQGHLGGLPPLSSWDPWMTGINTYAGNSGVESRATPAGRQLQTAATSQGYTSTLTATYSTWPIGSTIPSQCPYDLASLGSIVPDECCTSAPTTYTAGDFSSNACLSQPTAADPSLNVRSYLGCDNGIPTFGEICTPSGTKFGQSTYPFAGNRDTNDDLIGCRCSNNFQLFSQTRLPLQAIHYDAGCHVAQSPYMLAGNKVGAGADTAIFVLLSGQCIPPGATVLGDGVATASPINSITAVAPDIGLNPRISRVPIGASGALASGDTTTAWTMLFDRLEITERLNMYPWLADERRRNGPLGYRWGDLYGDGVYFCQYNFFNVSAHRPTWDELVPGYPGAFGIPVHGAAGATGPSSSCDPSFPGGFTAAQAGSAMQVLTNGFGFAAEGGVFQARNQQTRHTFSNYVFLSQTATTAATLNYNIVERYVNGIAMDGSNFLYHMNWNKVDGLWKAGPVKVIHFGDDRLGAVPTPEDFAKWLAFVQSAPFI